ncbi:hypothetical protein HED60_03625 [Planctomycetales bacterium ZRK34]|nr:hypothetical protein HED60_03625 [Planctomycetales bacterium ZRK34]
MIRTLMMLVLGASLTVGFTGVMTGCEKKSDTEKMVDDAKDKMEDAADTAKDKAEDAAEEVKDAVKDATN